MIETTGSVSPNAVYTLREACQFLKISEATARRWLRQGRLRGGKIGRDYRFLGSDLLGALHRFPQVSNELRPLTRDHPLLALVGIGDSGRSDTAEQHDRYLTDIHRRHR